MRREIRAAICGTTLLTIACAGPADQDVVVIAESGGIFSFFPHYASSDLEVEIGKLLFPGLNSARWRGGSVEYVIDDLALAESWEYGPDSTSLTYVLKPGARWSDGRPITTHDVVFTYEAVARPELALPFSGYVQELDSVVALDESRVRFYFRRRYPQMLLHSGLAIVPEHVYGDYTVDRATLAGHPALHSPGAGGLVVSGPYLVAEWRVDERLALEANSRSHATPANIGRVVFRFVPEPTSRLIQLRNGDVDMVNPVPPTQVTELKDWDIEIRRRGARFYDFIPWNGSRFEPFADPLVRRALSLAMDRRGILDGLGVQAVATPASSPYPSVFTELHDPAVGPDPYRPDSARSILRSLGWTDEDRDGVLERDGQALRFTLITASGAGLMRAEAAEIIQAQLADIGVDMSIRLLDAQAVNDVVFSDPARDFQAALVGWRVGLEPSLMADQFWPPTADYNVTGYESAALDTLMPLALEAPDRHSAARYWRAAERVIADARPYAFLWFYGEAVGLGDRVKGARIDILSVYQNLHRWRLEP